jgi:hypothetical protein
VDSDARLDFQDMARDLGLVPEMREVMEGEDACDKAKRKLAEGKRQPPKQDHSHQKGKQEDKRTKSKANALSKRTEQAQKSVDTLMRRLEAETDPSARRTLNDKLSRALALVDKTV